MSERNDRVDEATATVLEDNSASFANIIELMAAVERAVPDVREAEIAAALRRSAEADAREIKAVQEIEAIEGWRDYKLDAAKQIEELIAYFAQARRLRLQ
jgi:hypothetical protein